MKKRFLLGCLVIAAMTASADNVTGSKNKPIDVDSIMSIVEGDNAFHRLTPKYLTKYYTTDWQSNWFAGVQGGISCFVGNPKGCGDMFDRNSLTYGVYVGKWHNPFIGTRVMYQSGKFKDMFMKKRTFHSLQADFLYNVTNHLMTENQTLRRWDVIPYIGIGIIHGPRHSHEGCSCDACNSRNLGFMASYGIQGRYRATKRLYITAELGGFTTFNDFDDYGSRQNIGDGMISLRVGVAYNIGKNGWKHPVDARPYIAQNDYFLSNYEAYRNVNLALFNQHKMDQNTLEKLRDVLDSEGLLDQYGYLFDDKAHDKRNYYKGLLSLRSRLRDAQHPKIEHSSKITFEGKDSLLNAPVYFFFKYGKAKLTDDSQLVNLDEIARIANEHNLMLRIDGAADKASGSASFNKDLSKKRCVYICKQLKKRGVSAENMKLFAHGGVNEHSRKEEDRNSKVSVYTE